MAALARQMLRLAGDEELRRRLGRAGRVTAEKGFDGERLGRQLLSIYRDVCGVRQELRPTAAAV